MDPCDGAESEPQQCPSLDLKGGCPGATPLQRRLESVRRQSAPCVPPTPRRRIPQCSQLQENVDPQKVAFLLHKQWTLYSLTPLYKFSYSNLKEYSRLLNAFFTTEKQKGLAVEVGEDLSITVTFSTLLGVRGTQRDPDALLVQVLSKSALPSAGRAGKVLWTGWLCCVCGDSLLRAVSQDFTCLPLLLANGAESNTAIIGTWFQKTFDCYVSPLAISAFNLSWMAAMWTACKTDSCVATTELLWSVPCSPQSLDISYAIHSEDARALWDSVHKTPGEVTQEEVDLFMHCLESHFYRHFRIHLSATKLVRVSTSVASAHTDGKIKVSVNRPYILPRCRTVTVYTPHCRAVTVYTPRAAGL
ncbi:centromere protein L isoform X1 [Ochotona curzoniae]|uniref:centromere protein L isoform X1 n=1 Tax=Ochotona curzoniae TaxID=130825 RepID=UPI001B34877B|nr:centromere protein L isoform X1 [Ochotona curzoniae]XP_040840207.1 centromere protein L isoform X1 [Ochotona curzoniae]